jgi:hypothetical protein
LLDFHQKKENKLCLWPKSSFAKNFSKKKKKIAFLVKATTGASNNFGMKNYIFLEALIPLTSPALMKGASRENILGN